MKRPWLTRTGLATCLALALLIPAHSNRKIRRRCTPLTGLV